MSDIDITLYLNEYRVRALAEALGSQTAETVEDKLTEAFDTLYQDYVPDELRAVSYTHLDFMSGEYTINPLEPKAWTDSVEDIDANTPEAFKKVTRLSQHIAFLKDFFRSYKGFTDAQIDTIEILLSKLYARFGITDSTDYSVKKTSDFPVMQDFYNLCEEEFMTYDKQRKYLYTEETLQEVCLGIHSMCVGSESKYFNGHTNITDSNFLVFGVKAVSYTHLDRICGRRCGGSD